MPPPAPNPTVPLTHYHLTDIHKNRSHNLTGRPRPQLRLFHKSSPSLTPPKHLHKYINLHPELHCPIRMRSHLHNTLISIGAMAEETPVSSVARALSQLFTGRHSVLLYSRRASHFRRYDIHGVTRVVSYALPDNSLSYGEIVGGFIVRSIGQGRVTERPKMRVIFSEWGAISWRGSLVARVRVMCADKGYTFESV